MMENGTCTERCNRVKTSSSLSHVPVIRLTGIFSAEIKPKGIGYGAGDYITKPFDKDLLMAKVQTFLTNRTNLQNYFFNEINNAVHKLIRAMKPYPGEGNRKKKFCAPVGRRTKSRVFTKQGVAA